MDARELPARLRRWREENGLSFRALQARINEHLPSDEQVGVATLSDWERDGASGPRAPVLEAMVKAFPDLRLEWLLFGTGEVTKVATDILEEVDAIEYEGRLVNIPVWASLKDFPSSVRTAFASVLVHMYRSLPDAPDDVNSDEGRAALVELAVDLQDLLFLPSFCRAFHPRDEPGLASLDARQRESFGLAILHALSLLVPGPGAGGPFSDPDATRADGVLESGFPAHGLPWRGSGDEGIDA